MVGWKWHWIESHAGEKEEEEEKEDPKHLPELLNSMKSPGEHGESERRGGEERR